MKSTGGLFHNAAQNLQQLRTAVASWSVVALLLAIHAVVISFGGIERQSGWAVYKLLGLSRQGIVEGKLWKIFSYGLLHGTWLHLGVNALCVLLIGSRIEHMAGRAAMLKAALFGVLGGGLGHLLFSPDGVDSPLLVGFSGGCLGLLLLLTTLSPQSRMAPLPVSGRSLGLGILVTELFLSLVHPGLLIPGLSQIGTWMEGRGLSGLYDIGHACHFGGGLAGWIYGRWLLRPRITLKRLRADRERREAIEIKRGN
jgi:membrane associated rhomboid family serine protease